MLKTDAADQGPLDAVGDMGVRGSVLLVADEDCATFHSAAAQQARTTSETWTVAVLRSGDQRYFNLSLIHI